MSKTFPESSHLVWLTTALANRRLRIRDLLRRLAGFGPREEVNPEVDSKFMNLVGQVADAQEEEKHLLSRIEEIELKHRNHRDRDELERADPDYEPEADGEDEDEHDDDDEDNEFENKERHRRLWWFLARWLNKSEGVSIPKKQDLTND